MIPAQPHAPTTRSPATPQRGTLRAVFREAASTALPPWSRIAPTLAYTLRTVAAMVLSLYAAFALQLQSPSSAAVTVLIVANPVSGALVSKSLWRLAGTVVGAAVAVLLMAAFAQSPLLFFLALSLCIGAACLVSTLLRYFKAYGAVLAGYTIIIVCAPAFADPEHVFTNALSRLSAVSVGIAAAAIVFLLTSVRPPTRLSDASLGLIRSAGGALAGHVVEPSRDAGHNPGTEAARIASPNPGLAGFHDQRTGLLTQANALQEIIEYAVADSYAASRRAATLRLGAAGLLGTLSSLHPHYPRLTQDPAPGPGREPQPADAVRAAIEAVRDLSVDNAAQVLARLAGLRSELQADPAATPPDLPHPVLAHAGARTRAALAHVGARTRAADLLGRLHDAITGLIGSAAAPQPRRRGGGLRLFLDWPSAARNAARGFLVTMLACMAWYVTQWPSGPVLLSFLVPASCLLATNPSASRASVDFALGTLLAIPASYVCEALMLPQIAGFPLLAAVMTICLLPGIWLQFNPRYGLRAFGYVVFFSAMISVRNPIVFDDPGLINNWLAFGLGTASLVVVFRALLPANPVRDADRLARSVVRATEAIARTPQRLPAWEFLQMQRVSRLSERLRQAACPHHHQVIDAALATVELGRDIHRLRLMLADARLDAPAGESTRQAIAALGRLSRNPAQAARAAEAAASRLAASPSPASLRGAALLHEAGILIGATASFLSRDFSVRHAQ